MFRINGFNSTKFGRLPIEKLMQGYADQNNELKGYVPLAYDGGGNSFMLILKKESAGVVYLWIQDEMRLERVCSSFEGFISSLRVA